MGGRVLAIAGLVVVAGIIALFVIMRDDEPTAPAPATPAEPKAAVAGDAGPSAPVVSARPRNPVVPLRRPTPTTGAESTGGGTPAPTLASEPPDDAAKPKKELPPIHKALNEQIWETETWIAECNERALKAGSKLSGVAAYSFTLKRQGTKVVVDATGVEYTTIPDGAISDCMRDVSKRFVIDASALPEGVDTLVGYRKVLLDNGALKENWLTEYHPVPPAPPAP